VLTLQVPSGDGPSESAARLVLVGCSTLPFVDIHPGGCGGGVVQQCLAQGAVVALEGAAADSEEGEGGVRARTIQMPGRALPPLSVSGPRGVG
jgi:hypothetical protein